MRKRYYSEECKENAVKLMGAYHRYSGNSYIDAEPVRAKRAILKDFTKIYNMSDRGRFKLTDGGLAVVVDYYPHSVSEYSIDVCYSFEFLLYVGQNMLDNVKDIQETEGGLRIICEHIDMTVRLYE